MNSLIGGRTRSKSPPNRRPSNGAGTSATPNRGAPQFGCKQYVQVGAAREKSALRAGLKDVNGLYTRGEVGLALTAGSRRVSLYQAFEISRGLGDAVLVACRLALCVLRNPKRARGGRRRAPDPVGLFNDQDVETLQLREYCRG